MLANRCDRSGLDRGFSLIETMAVLVILAIIITLAIITLGSSKENLERQNIAREFKVSLERARFDSVKRRAVVCSNMSSVTISSSGSFSVSTDMNQNGELEVDVESRHVDFGNRSNVTLIGNGVTLPVTIRFDERGRAFLRSDCDPSSIPTASVPLFYFCNGSCTVSTANSENANAIFISPSGTVAMMTGDSEIPVFDDPDVDTVDANTGVDNRLAVWTGTPPTPTPLPPFPSVSPTPLPSVTPADPPSGEPTPTPTPIRSCNYNEKPHGNPPTCICRAPMYAGNGGKCVGPAPTPTPSASPTSTPTP